MSKETIWVLSGFGISIRLKLFEICKTQTRLIGELRKKAGLYADSSILHKLSCREMQKN